MTTMETAPAAAPINRMAGLLAPFRKLMAEVSKFGTVGLIALVIDVGLFNLMLLSPWMMAHPITAKAISVVVATTASYFLNRKWTYNDRETKGDIREYVLFFVFNGIAMLITLGCLWFSHYALGLTSALADNISANVIGLALGTAFRFWAYRTYVFPKDPLDAVGEIDVAIIGPRQESAPSQAQAPADVAQPSASAPGPAPN